MKRFLPDLLEDSNFMLVSQAYNKENIQICFCKCFYDDRLEKDQQSSLKMIDSFLRMLASVEPVLVGSSVYLAFRPRKT